MQVDALDCRSMERRFLLGNHRERAIGAVLHRCRRRRARQDLTNLFQMTPVRLWRNVKIDLLARDLAALDVGDTDADALQA